MYIESLFSPSKTSLLVHLYSSSLSCLSVKRKAELPSVERTQSLTLKEVRRTTISLFTLQSTSITLWLRVCLASAAAIHPLLSTERSSNKCILDRCRAAWEWIRCFFFPKTSCEIKLNRDEGAINSRRGSIVIYGKIFHSLSARFSLRTHKYQQINKSLYQQPKLLIF